MAIARRHFLHLATGAAALPLAPRLARADTWPSRPVHIVSGFPPGGPADILGRLIGQWLSERLGQAFIVENRPGAGSNTATELIARGPADGYTLLVMTSANTINATLYDKLNYNFIRDMAPVAGFIRVPQVLEVHPSVPVALRPRVHRLCQGQPRQAQHGLGRHRHRAARRRRAVQRPGRHENRARALSRPGAGAARPDGGPDPGDVQLGAGLAAADQGRQGQAARRDHRDALRGPAGSAGGGRFRAGLRVRARSTAW